MDVTETLSCLKGCSLNVRSVKNKTTVLYDFIESNGFDFVAFTETWLRPGDHDSPVIAELCPPGYSCCHVPRQSGYGGVAVVHKTSLGITKEDGTHYHSFEHQEVVLKTDNISIRLIVIYRPPASKKNKANMRIFLNDFSTLLESCVHLPGQLLIVGDFNIHVDRPDLPQVSQFCGILKCHGLRQHVLNTTHKNGHILDLVVTREEEDISVWRYWIT